MNYINLIKYFSCINFKMHIYSIFVFLFLTSCEGYVHINGTVIDNSTNTAISNANITCINDARLGIPREFDSTNRKLKNQYIFTTDSLGKFEIKSGFIGFGFGIPKFKLKIQKDGYKTQKIKGNGDFVIKLERDE